jgi:hypothetical protein
VDIAVVGMKKRMLGGVGRVSFATMRFVAVAIFVDEEITWILP